MGEKGRDTTDDYCKDYKILVAAASHAFVKKEKKCIHA